MDGGKAPENRKALARQVWLADTERYGRNGTRGGGWEWKKKGPVRNSQDEKECIKGGWHGMGRQIN